MALHAPLEQTARSGGDVLPLEQSQQTARSGVNIPPLEKTTRSERVTGPLRNPAPVGGPSPDYASINHPEPNRPLLPHIMQSSPPSMCTGPDIDAQGDLQDAELIRGVDSSAGLCAFTANQPIDLYPVDPACASGSRTVK